MLAVVGAGSFGSALASALAACGRHVTVIGRSPAVVEEINGRHSNVRYLPGTALHENVRASLAWGDAAGAEAVILAVPSQSLRAACRALSSAGARPARVIVAAKGLEQGTKMRMSEVARDEWGIDGRRLAALSGPSHAEEIAWGLPTTLVSASASRDCAEYAQNLFMSDRVRVYTNPDIAGVELGGALKNIIALGCGIADGLSCGDNAKAALMTRGLTEITRLGVRLGAAQRTFSGLAGVGDLIVTCTSRHSRNWQAGFWLGGGMALPDALAKVGMTVEGVAAARVAAALADELAVSMPIARAIAAVLFSGRAPAEAVDALMTRTRTHEMEEYAQEEPIGWQYP